MRFDLAVNSDALRRPVWTEELGVKATSIRPKLLQSMTGASAEENAPMPQWGWGEVKGMVLPGPGLIAVAP